MSYFDSKKRVKSQKFFAIIATVSLFIVGTTYAGGGGGGGGGSNTGTDTTGGGLTQSEAETARQTGTYAGERVTEATS